MRVYIDQNKQKLGVVFLGALLTLSAMVLNHYWPYIVLESMQWQKQIYRQFSSLLVAAKSDSSAILMLTSLSFLYGLLHSLGPGHGKIIVSTYVATQPTKVKISLWLTLLSSLMQAVVAVLLVSVLIWLFAASIKLVQAQAQWLIQLSYYLVIGLGLTLIYRTTRQFWKVNYEQVNYKKNQGTAVKYKSLTKLSANQSHLHSHLYSQLHCHVGRYNNESLTDQITHIHSNDCGCGHEHVVDAEKINNASTWREYAAVIFSIGLRPCSGAIMVLLFAKMLDIYWLGIVGAFAMALGTALTTSTIALLTISGKRIVTTLFLNDALAHQSRRYTTYLRFALALLGGVLLVLMGAILVASEPVIAPEFIRR